MVDIKAKFIASIERTGDPFAPIKLEEAYKACSSVGKLFAHISDLQTTQAMSDRLLKDFPDEMDNIACDPNFICALSGLLYEALAQYARGLDTDKPL